MQPTKEECFTSYHRDPTASQAIGNVDREWKQLARLAWQIRTSPRREELEEAHRRTFTGIHRKLMTCPLDELEKEAGRKK